MIAEREDLAVCRFCCEPLRDTFYPLHLRVCRYCFLVQLDATVSGQDIQAVERVGFTPNRFVVELSGNGGSSEQEGVPTLVEFFGVATAQRLARERGYADLIIGNNVLAQVSDLNDFVGGVGWLLNAGGTFTLEFPHLSRLIERNQFETIHREHHSYLSLYTTERIFVRRGLRIFDVEELSMHGGSLRVWGCHATDGRAPTARLQELRARELSEGVNQLKYYSDFSERTLTRRN